MIRPSAHLTAFLLLLPMGVLLWPARAEAPTAPKVSEADVRAVMEQVTAAAAEAEKQAAAMEAKAKEAAKKNEAEAAKLEFELGLLQQTALEQPKQAAATYERFMKEHKNSPFMAQAAYQHGLALLDSATNEEEKKKALKALEGSVYRFRGAYVLAPGNDGELTWQPLSTAVGRRLDPIYAKGSRLYQILDTMVGIAGKVTPTYRHGLAVILLTILVKLLLHPLTKTQYRSMKAMQKLQPEIKRLQDKYKGDKANPQKMNQEMMDLYRREGVNPMGGCLPMLVQLPILICLYRAIIQYKFQFEGAHFLWIGNLARPDMPLFVLYMLSMIVSQRLTMMPSADPAQQQSQKMMMYMMPVMFFVFFRSFPSAFILYWLTYNVLSTTEQLRIYRQADGGSGLGGIVTLSPNPPAQSPPPTPAPATTEAKVAALSSRAQSNPGTGKSNKSKKKKRKRRRRR